MTELSRRGFIAALALLGAMPSLARGQAAGAQPPEIRGTLAYTVLDPATGRVLAEQLGDMPMPPASTLKTVTALYALDRLGAEHRFPTRVIRAGNTLILAGGGDPVLDTDALAALALRTAAQHEALGLPAPTGFLVWGGALPRVARLDPSQAEHLPYNPTISGMMLNFNRVHLDWRRGAEGYQMSLQARGRKLSPRAYTISAAPVSRPAPVFAYDGGSARESWTLARGAMGRAGSRWLPVRRPELYAGDVFQTLCRAKGLVLPNPVAVELLPEGDEIARHDSPPLREIVAGMMEYSTNLTAEAIGLAASGAADLPASAAAMAGWLNGQRIAGDFRFRDHSGLSPENAMTSNGLARAIATIGARQDLRGVMKRIPFVDARGKPVASSIRVAAKTGTLNFVSNLAGYAQEADGRMLIFVIFGADLPRHEVSRGQELPEGVIDWTRRAKAAQQGLLEAWFAQEIDHYAIPQLDNLPPDDPLRALIVPAGRAAYEITPGAILEAGRLRRD
ncbi:D-alanyl-D-alanine carboxypeptidase / D-alanyl-D-alanine-endopeptidase (penicillin-binding protein 4) [Paracoccus halophilus]|uniref:D-alanyl-D-alanine carboxypeptidase / D-alanyl-D-alanine-endopeptidase (Penicillin-binding protein 4) n=1 Tax=Paracoccus halophilus TaxID=376733 RepID=A0A1I0T316_9RHOB|nr:D-alanyl-D-alanine carboxypeptidase [Paracoccus halophilus]SFA46174.1 D-alanyl-D-alanine carboxypeptidase / D-alanyl-D-alanine-endopeptidase (penicillin-binding protein 4) [Paracoccus halophilus]